jgi:hypothetical protein
VGLLVDGSPSVPVGIEESCRQVLRGFDWPGSGALGEAGI